MLKGPFLDRNWMGQNEDYESSNIVMLGMPFDGTVSYRPGSRFAPEQIRLASWGLEEYSPYFDKHLEDCNFHDVGDLEFPLGKISNISLNISISPLISTKSVGSFLQRLL